jgi:glycine/D-amino acid oxidase-like deaminating enzyme
MTENHSPWIKQLKRTRPVASLPGDLKTDIAIIGGGIAGVTTAFFLLRDTDLNVALVEATKVAHGATGHNAGQAVPYFERPFSDLVKEFGLKLAAEGQKMIESTWMLFEEIYQEAQLETPLSRFTGYAGFRSIDQFLLHLQNNAWRVKAGMTTEPMYLAEHAEGRDRIPSKFEGLYSLIKHEHILDLIETKDSSYIGALSDPKGVMNSARFCEELVGYMLNHFGHRFVLAEHTPVRVVRLHKNDAELKTQDHTITCSRVVLCTNGFTNIRIENSLGSDIDAKFHHAVSGDVGYMSAFLEPLKRPPVGISYLSGETSNADEPYYYMTRRAYEEGNRGQYNLICMGGPERLLENVDQYKSTDPVEEKALQDLDAFVRRTYKYAPKKISYAFRWHGLMGYTKNRIRLVGPEPCNPVLMYNLGCNGTGILASVCGSKRISEFVIKKTLPPSIFDPRDSRCLVEITVNKRASAKTRTA